MPYRLEEADIERLLFVMEASLHVHTSTGFFLWTQGALQSVIPHEILICMLAKGPSRPTEMRWYSSSRYFQKGQFEQACGSPEALMQQLLREWFEYNRPQLLVGQDLTPELAAQLKDLELRNLIAHGVAGDEFYHGGYFCFGRTTVEDPARTSHILDLLMPCIYSTYCSVHAEEGRQRFGARGASVLTARELEIITRVKDGLTTADIAVGLGLSPFTVRNHIKRIFRKLGARSRSHAVAQAIALGILR
ncbi:MAG: XrtB/PEP-CTERM-associated transcriptional regulator EpsA [Rhodocyclaceae bacterium]